METWHEPAADWRFRCTVPAAASAVVAVRLWPQEALSSAPRVAVYGPQGRLGHRLLWSAPGEPLHVLLDGSEPGPRWCYIGPDLPDGPDWEAPGGLVLASRHLARARVEDPAGIGISWEAGGAFTGRDLVPAIFHGFNPLGPDQQCVLRYQGWFQAPAAGSYRFATISDDASLLRIDGRDVLSWPGWHGADAGRRGEHDVRLDLTAGRHA
ncbi:MAG: hypothetical protein ACOCXJ_00275, partial [Planctomycetota bacterium]